MDSQSEGECPACDRSAVIVAVPEACRGLLEGDPATVLLCEHCLQVHPAPGRPVDAAWEPGETSSALPNDAEASVALGMLITFLSSLALHRREAEAVVAYLEEYPGVDPLIALDRVTTAPLLDPAIDIDRRRHQLAQLLDDPS